MHKVRILGATMVNTSYHAPKQPMPVQKFIELERLDRKAAAKFPESALQKMLEKFSKQDGKVYILAPSTNE